MIKPEMQAVVDLFESQEYHQYLGIKVQDCGDGHCRLKISVHKRITNPVGTVHGGVLYSVCAVASSLAALSSLEQGKYTVANDFNVSVLRGISSGHLTVEGKVLKRGSRLVFVEVAILDSEDNLVAKGRVTKSVMP